MDFSKQLFRCSSLGDLMTDGRNAITDNQLTEITELIEKSKVKELTPKQKSDLKKLIKKRDNPELSETCKAKLVEIYVRAVYGRKKDISNKYMEKGLAMEEDLFTLYSRVTKRFYKKNTTRLNNDFITGEPDLFEGEEIVGARKIIDGKTSWDIWTFHSVLTKPISRDYWWQIQGYSGLTGAQELGLMYGLVNTPEPLIRKEEYYLALNMNVIDKPHNSLYVEGCQELRKAMTYDDIPIENRIIEFNFKRDQAAIQAIYERVPLWREFLAGLHKRLHPEVLKVA